MPKYVIEREMPGAGELGAEELTGISERSCETIRALDAPIQWLHSYVTDDKIFCVYIAPDEDSLRAHARAGGFPLNRICRIRSVIDPTSAE